MIADVRAPAVAGQFYPGDPAALRDEVARCLGDASAARSRIAVLAPHAGYVYSGGVAGRVFAATIVPEHVIVLAPNHTGRGARRAVWAHGALALPGGALDVDEPLVASLLGHAGLRADRDAHLHEHAVEVELPFLRARRPDVKITAIVLSQLERAQCADLAAALTEATAGLDVLLVASSDLNHYLDDATTRALDARLIERLLALDPAGLHDTVLREGHSMCGFVPATVMLDWARARGATGATLQAYATSAEAFGDRDRVVGYAGVTVQ